MNVGRFQAAWLGLTNEVSLAAAQFNFDFTLVKCEAPKEYQQLGAALSRQRKEDAESGSTHITARRLGALFEGVCPATPNLLKAYGTRVSETAQHAKTTQEPEVGIFSAQSGVDGTSIWAAATSSLTALKVQLLACILARVWPPAEATSVWVELVKERREALKAQFEAEGALPYATMAAAVQAEISRAQLAEWDASVRAWLRTADRIHRENQGQLMLLVNKLNIAIDGDMAVYKGVMSVWKSALQSLEQVVSGMPQAMSVSSSGPILLALSSWHIYPNLVVIDQPSASHRFHDPLVAPGGVLTVGLPPPGETEPRGIFWSLSLAHLNYYGGPVAAEAQLGLTSSKMTFAQFCQAATGCFLGYWSVPRNKFPVVAEFLVSARDEICGAVGTSRDRGYSGEHDSCSAFLADRHHWLKILARAMGDYADQESSPDISSKKLLNFGVKRCFDFLPTAAPRSFLGFSEPANIIRCLKGPQERITFLRHIVATSQTEGSSGLVIRFVGYHAKQRGFATAHPVSHHQVSGETHMCWLPNSFQHSDRFAGNLIDSVAEADAERELENGVFELGDPPERFRFLYGDPGTAALFQAASIAPQLIRLPAIEDLVWCIKHRLVSLNLLLRYLNMMAPRFPDTRALNFISLTSRIFSSIPDAGVSPRALARPIYDTKWALEAVARVRKQNQPAIINMDAVRKKANAMQELLFVRTIRDRPISLACAAYMESGLDLNPRDLGRVFAFAFEDSIYVCMKLTCDPWESPGDHELKRVVGNVGKPGITLLIPPVKPMVRKRDPTSWRFTSDTEFNGAAEDHFTHTSLHLSFTDYYAPLTQAGQQHGQDHLVFFRESIVSVYDSGDWVGDLDVLRSLESNQVERMKSPPCTCQPSQSSQGVVNLPVTSVESWDEVLDPPSEEFVVRASGNWVARLATTSMLIQVLPANFWGKIQIWPSSTCWKCNRQATLGAGGGSQSVSTIHFPGLVRGMVY